VSGDAKACAVCGSSYTTELDALVRAGLLEPQSRQDENAIADALYAHLGRTLEPRP
jgi:hypothetical protein